MDKTWKKYTYILKHEFYLQNSLNILNKIKKGGLVFDFKSTFLNLILKIKILKYGHFKINLEIYHEMFDGKTLLITGGTDPLGILY